MKNLQKILDKNKEFMIIPDGIIVFNCEGKIIAINEAAERITGYLEEEAIGKDYHYLLVSASMKIDHIRDVIDKGSTYSNLPVDILCSDNKEINVLSSLTPITKSDRTITSVIFVFRNTTEIISLAESLEKTTRSLLDERNKLDAIFNSTLEGTFTIDNDWNITSFNTAAETITGYNSEEALGKKCWDIFKSSVCRNGCHMETTIAKNKNTIGNELTIISKSGKETPIKVNSAPLLNSNKEQIGAVETFLDITELKNLSDQLIEKYQYENIIGKSVPMQKVFSLLDNVAQADCSVLITGESGTGKELIARAIHSNSRRKTGPFIAINCSAFAESIIESELFGHEKGAFTGALKTKIGKFELAQGGTLFLDEIGDISLSIQVKLLRILEALQFERVGGNETIDLDVRVIAATNKDLQKEISEGRFREDLYYRLNVVNINLPPLRERMDDLPLLIEYFLTKLNKKFQKKIKAVAAPACKILSRFNWPGNIRELENVLEHAFVLCKGDVILPEHLPDKLTINLQETPKSVVSDVKNPIKNAEKEAIIAALKRCNGNRTQTAEDLGIDKSTLWRKMKKYKTK